MGQAASAIVNALDRSKEDEMKAKEQLELMMKLADARLNTFEGELKSMFLDHESAMKTSVPGKRALRFERYVQVDTESTPGDGVDKAVDAFFGAGDTGLNGVLDGFKNVVKTGLSTILGDTSAGESYDKNNAIIRVDMYTYKYNFATKGVISTHKNILAYILCISVVDHRDVTVDELIYLASEFAGDGAVGPDSGFEKYLEMIMKTWNKLKAIDPLPTVGRQAIDYPSLAVRSVGPAFLITH
ncbi:uncharacterized protein F4817DRAFT_319836 [Daldinia loculata]|uniref:uncharacterized protein n=1 Tax=Daldinia loculata TaxID=103429 RepID=UPI0020C38D5B|nr:uncharacterized protein F4817DRAFT_319836 [Daldinia loculata]KAI1643435.1 hypothetical protein F4817DRAFT_319836 [Daldinia loculata]